MCVWCKLNMLALHNYPTSLLLDFLSSLPPPSSPLRHYLHPLLHCGTEAGQTVTRPLFSVCVCVCVCVCMRVHVHVHVCVCVCVWRGRNLLVHVHIHAGALMYVCMYACSMCVLSRSFPLFHSTCRYPSRSELLGVLCACTCVVCLYTGTQYVGVAHSCLVVNDCPVSA